MERQFGTGGRCALYWNKNLIVPKKESMHKFVPKVHRTYTGSSFQKEPYGSEKNKNETIYFPFFILPVAS